MKWIFKIFIIFVFCGFYVRYKPEFKKTILDKHLQFRLVRVSIEINLILTCRSCSKSWSTGLGRDTINYLRQQVGGVIFDVGSHVKPKRLQRTKSFGLRWKFSPQSTSPKNYTNPILQHGWIVDRCDAQKNLTICFFVKWKMKIVYETYNW